MFKLETTDPFDFLLLKYTYTGQITINNTGNMFLK